LRQKSLKIISICHVMAGVAFAITMLIRSLSDCRPDQEKRPAAGQLKLVSA
jgi:hypothetical protein